MFLLKGAAPERYRERYEVGGVLGNVDLDRLSDEQLQRIAVGEHPLSVLGSPPGYQPGGLLTDGNDARS